MKPAQPAKTDFLDDVRLLILRKLLKLKEYGANPAYRPVRHFSRTYEDSHGCLTVLSSYRVPHTPGEDNLASRRI